MSECRTLQTQDGAQSRTTHYLKPGLHRIREPPPGPVTVKVAGIEGAGQRLVINTTVQVTDSAEHVTSYTVAMIGGQVGFAQEGGGDQDEAASFEGVVARGELVEVTAMRPGGDVNLLAFGVEDVAGERHPVFPADQSSNARVPRAGAADAGAGDFMRGEAGGVAVAPDETFAERGNQLAVSAENFPF